MRIGFITTINTNIGDDFIRTGIENILASIKNEDDIQYTYVNKHYPDSSVVKYSPIHLLKRLKPFRGRGRLLNFYNKFLYSYFSVYKDQDLIIQSGAPVLWPDCQKNEWAQPIWYNTIGKLKSRIPVINLAAGSCYPWERYGSFYSEKEAAYAKDIGGFCRLTTTRDKLANKLFSSVGIENVLMPCTAFFVDKGFENKAEGKYILINYMKGGGHFDWSQKVDADLWEASMKRLITALLRNHEVRFICHNEKEIDQAKAMFPDLTAYYPKTIEDYLNYIRHAKLGINNRMHASVAMASVGVPAISICTDTRLLMLENIGLPVYYVKDADFESLYAKSVELLDNSVEERKKLFKLKKEKFEEYGILLKQFID